MLWLACIAPAALACGGADKTTGPPPRDVTGTYTYAFSNLGNGSGVVCSGTATMPVTQTGATFSGTYFGTQTCRYASTTDTWNVSGTVVNGRVVGDSVYFNMDGDNWRNFGVLQGSDMSGTVNGSFIVNGTPSTYAGNFTCVKQ